MAPALDRARDQDFACLPGPIGSLMRDPRTDPRCMNTIFASRAHSVRDATAGIRQAAPRRARRQARVARASPPAPAAPSRSSPGRAWCGARGCPRRCGRIRCRSGSGPPLRRGRRRNGGRGPSSEVAPSEHAFEAGAVGAGEAVEQRRRAARSPSAASQALKAALTLPPGSGRGGGELEAADAELVERLEREGAGGGDLAAEDGEQFRRRAPGPAPDDSRG